MDKLTKEQRRKNMRAVKSKGSKIEQILGKALWHKGYRYRKNDKTVFGKPDIVFTKILNIIESPGSDQMAFQWIDRDIMFI